MSPLAVAKAIRVVSKSLWKLWNGTAAIKLKDNVSRWELGREENGTTKMC